MPGLRRFLLLLTGLIVIGAVIAFALVDNLGSSVRWFSDPYDRLIYWRAGSWVTTGQAPNVGSFSEYPQAATLLFGLPYSLLSALQPGRAVEVNHFAAVFSLLMLAVLAVTVYLLHALLPAGRQRLAYLLLLPPVIFFAFNRFDIVPSLLVLLSLWTMRRQRWALTGIVLGAAVMTKWYAGLLLPLYLRHLWTTQRRIEWRLLAAFGGVVFAFVVPTLVQGGPEALLSSYRFHLERGLEPGSLVYAINAGWQAAFGAAPTQALVTAGLALQFAGLTLAALSRLARPDDVVRAAIAAIAAFMLFGRYYSPQWLLWLLPLLVLAARRGRDVGLIVAFSLLSYLAFPVAYDLAGPGAAFAAVGVALAGFLLFYIVHHWPPMDGWPRPSWRPAPVTAAPGLEKEP